MKTLHSPDHIQNLLKPRLNNYNFTVAYM